VNIEKWCRTIKRGNAGRAEWFPAFATVTAPSRRAFESQNQVLYIVTLLQSFPDPDGVHT
jgi:hypothetical protein